MDGASKRQIKVAKRQDVEDLTKMASILWPDHDKADLRCEMDGIIEKDKGIIYLCLHGGKPIGFAHCSIRGDYVEGAEKSPTAYLEGIFVMPENRGEGVASDLLRHCEVWAAEMGCEEIASDCELNNLESERFHLRSGFSEANRIICFIKSLES